MNEFPPKLRAHGESYIVNESALTVILGLGVTLINTFYGQSNCQLVYLFSLNIHLKTGKIYRQHTEAPLANNSNLSLMVGVLLSPQTPLPEPDQSALWRRCHSQFTDVDDYRRHERNTWHDESGVYANSALRDEVIKPTNPIPERLA